MVATPTGQIIPCYNVLHILGLTRDLKYSSSNVWASEVDDFFFTFVFREVVNEFEIKQLRDRVALAMCACDSANKLKVWTGFELSSTPKLM